MDMPRVTAVFAVPGSLAARWRTVTRPTQRAWIPMIGMLGIVAIVFGMSRYGFPFAVLAGLVTSLVIVRDRWTASVASATEAVVLVGNGPDAGIVAALLSEAGARRGTTIWRSRQPLPSLLEVRNVAEAVTQVRSTPCREVVITEPVVPWACEMIDARGQRPPVITGLEAVERLLGRVLLDTVPHGHWLERRQEQDTRSLDRAYAAAKRAVDVIVAVALGLVVLPLVPLIALAIRLDSLGPVISSQIRVGRGGRQFRIYKFRTVEQDAEPMGAVRAQERVTRLGRFLRLTRIDELPQLWTILRGDMTLVGPSPERPELTARLEQELPSYATRHVVKPGLTGWAQVRYRHARTVNNDRKRLEYDLYYVKHASLGLDLRILLDALGIVVSHPRR